MRRRFVASCARAESLTPGHAADSSQRLGRHSPLSAWRVQSLDGPGRPADACSLCKYRIIPTVVEDFAPRAGDPKRPTRRRFISRRLSARRYRRLEPRRVPAD